METKTPPAFRKLTFAAPCSPSQTDSNTEFEKDPKFPREWKINGVDFYEKVEKLREELNQNESTDLRVPIFSPKAKFRSECRRILNANDIVNEALRLNNEQLNYAKNSQKSAELDIEQLRNRRIQSESDLGRLRDQLTRLDCGILKSTQAAVKSVIELREDEYIADDGDSNLSEEFQKYSNISKLCDVALKSYTFIKKRTEELQKEVMASRNKTRKHQEAMRNLMNPDDVRRVDEAEKQFGELSLEQLLQLRNRMRTKK